MLMLVFVLVGMACVGNIAIACDAASRASSVTWKALVTATLVVTVVVLVFFLSAVESAMKLESEAGRSPASRTLEKLGPKPVLSSITRANL
jgi:hypothetical protein